MPRVSIATISAALPAAGALIAALIMGLIAAVVEPPPRSIPVRQVTLDRVAAPEIAPISEPEFLIDPFTMLAHAAAVPETRPSAESIDAYLCDAYKRLPQKRDGAGDFTWKDPKAAKRFGLDLCRYVIGGMDPDFREQLYAAGKAMDAKGIKWSMLSAFRDDYRQSIATGLKAAPAWSKHGGSKAVGGYGKGRAVDVWTAHGPIGALFGFIDGAGRKLFSLHRPYGGGDPAHVEPTGDWRRTANKLRTERLTIPIIDTVREIAGADVIGPLARLVTGLEPTKPIVVSTKAKAKTETKIAKIKTKTKIAAKRTVKRVVKRHRAKPIEYARAWHDLR